ncbi:MAG: hypothetical protein ACOYMC_09645, partial [Pirellulales bacterium]
LTNPLHHLWCNNGTWWVHSTLHFGGRKRRIHRSLGTAEVSLAVLRPAVSQCGGKAFVRGKGVPT